MSYSCTRLTHPSPHQPDTPAALLAMAPTTTSAQPPVPHLQERAESRKGSGLCHSLVRGVPCQFGEQCRFNHDVEAFLRSKGPELPGRCPFLAAGTCAYGGSAPMHQSYPWRSQLDHTAAQAEGTMHCSAADMW